MILVSTIVGWNLLLDWLAARVPLFTRLAAPPPLVQNGRIHYRHLRKEMLTRDDLMGKLRLHGRREPGRSQARVDGG